MSMFWKVLLFSFVIFALYTILKIYVLSKLKISKWIILALATVFLLIQVPSSVGNYAETLTIVKSALFVFFILWFFDIISGNMNKFNEGAKKKNDIKIRPKAKPNRVKHLNKEEKK